MTPHISPRPRPSAGYKAVLWAIATIAERDRRPPTVRELSAETGLKSSSTVHAHLQSLRCDGYIDWDDNLPRTLHLTEAGKRALGLSPVALKDVARSLEAKALAVERAPLRSEHFYRSAAKDLADALRAVRLDVRDQQGFSAVLKAADRLISAGPWPTPKETSHADTH